MSCYLSIYLPDEVFLEVRESGGLKAADRAVVLNIPQALLHSGQNIFLSSNIFLPTNPHSVFTISISPCFGNIGAVRMYILFRFVVLSPSCLVSLLSLTLVLSLYCLSLLSCLFIFSHSCRVSLLSLTIVLSRYCLSPLSCLFIFSHSCRVSLLSLTIVLSFYCLSVLSCLFIVSQSCLVSLLSLSLVFSLYFHFFYHLVVVFHS